MDPIEALQALTARVAVTRALDPAMDVTALEDEWCDILEQAAERYVGGDFWKVVDRCLDFLA